MARLSLAARNTIVQLPEIQALVSSGLIGSDDQWSDGWVFDNHLTGRILDEESEKAAIVVTESNWMEPNPHNTAKFPLLMIDIWAAPLKDDENSIVEYNADDIIETVFNALFPYFHTVNKDVPGNTGDAFIPYMGDPGKVRIWGRADQIADRTGYPVLSSQLIQTSDFKDVQGANGARARSHMFGVESF